MCKAKKLVCCIAFLMFIGINRIYSQKEATLPQYDLFLNAKSETISDALTINANALYQLVKQKPNRLKFDLVLEGKRETISFKKQNLWSDNYRLSSSDDLAVSRSKLHYRGSIGQDHNSRAYLTFDGYKIALQLYKGNRMWRLANADSKSNQRGYNLIRKFLKNQRESFQCSSALENEWHSNYSGPDVVSNNHDAKVSVYIEADYAMYQKFNNSIEDTENYITSVFEQVAHIYANEQIDIEISEIKVWDTPDPYDLSSTNAALISFRSQIGSNFNGDLAHLISGNAIDHGGKAFIDALCDKSRAFGYSNFLGTFTQPSDYSWDAFLMAHELGHNFGSHHTHDCVWGPNNDKVLDYCYQPEENCEILDPGPLPGTIMSYCHLTPVGVSFEAGFGQEPGNLIREKYNACMTEIGISCETAIEINSNGKLQAIGPVKGYGASQTSADHANWFKFTPDADGRIKIFNCETGVDSRLWIHTGACGELITITNSDDECGPQGSQAYSSNIPHLMVNAGETLFFEWDDRWSNDGFEFWFKFGAIVN